ncbi:MAG TPA: FAD/NAD(P)-binding protein [Candidatus Melainabacteria bacterium]|nr:FAD/NAD(P)-binding protein [Candidatus Melainabacteria bacterium]
MITVAIIGGGFSGALTVVNLIQQAVSPVKIVLIEPRSELGKGVAYSTQFAGHLLNVPAGRMSAFPDEPLHFLKWARTKFPKLSETAFVPRALYGEYVQDILQSAITNLPNLVTFERFEDEVLSLKLIQDDTKAVLKLASGDVIVADRVVLATGNNSPTAPTGVSQGIANSDRYINDPWKSDHRVFDTAGGDLLLIGTGLTMVDTVIELVQGGFDGTIYAVSRHGLLPRAHSKNSFPAFAQTELNQELYGDLILLFKAVKESIRSGSFEHLFDNASTVKMDVSDWRQVIDSLRPHSQALWGSLSDKQKKRFLRHIRTYWDVHRHRMAPEIGEEIEKLVQAGKLKVLAGRLYSVNETSEALIATVMPRGGGQPQQLKVSRMLNCSGISLDFRRSKSTLAQSLLTRGIVHPHSTGLGLSVRSDGAVLDVNQKPSKVLFTLGTITLGLRGETVAVPELRVQTRELARTLLQSSQTMEFSMVHLNNPAFELEQIKLPQ